MKHTTPARAPSQAHWKRVLLALLAVAVAFLAVAVAFVAAPTPEAQADINVYTTPGHHTVNGRQWRTTCGPYSSVIDRCRAEIWASRTAYVGGQYVTTTGWVTNNLTYLPAPRAAWAGNPLAIPGEHTIAGRKWKTECDTAWTGPSACRSSIWATVIEGTKNSAGAWTFAPVTKWVINSIVMFTDAAAGTCPGAVLPEKYAITNGKPHQIKVPYPDSTLYNPTSISNFIRETLVDGRNSPAQQACLATLGGNTLIDGGVRKATPDGKTALWFHYLFPYSANPSTDTLQPGWISGLAQGGALGALSLLHERTGDPKWLNAAKETFESYTVPLAQGGFTHEVNGALWFEEYPTTPVPTTVLNGHLEAVIALDMWQRHSGDPRATALFKRAIAGLKKIIPDE
ncbi:MAG: D-glucuronyl C5-epimerase family protein, partial [Ornithinibacter sp.]